jgi:mRNA-degrading endonuclease YafQ of YafQ-DinJ toxin-antitoxin module
MYTVDISTIVHRIVKKYRGDKRKSFDKIVEKLKQDPFQESLRTHKLKGELSEVYSCRIDYNDRALFILIQKYSVLIVDVGNHDEVY